MSVAVVMVVMVVVGGVVSGVGFAGCVVVCGGGFGNVGKLRTFPWRVSRQAVLVFEI